VVKKRVMVVASSKIRANELADELGIERAYAVSTRKPFHGQRGLTADAILVDESAMPLSDDEAAALAPCLFGSEGHMYSLSRIF
jgi:hypothetical protein